MSLSDTVDTNPATVDRHPTASARSLEPTNPSVSSSVSRSASTARKPSERKTWKKWLAGCCALIVLCVMGGGIAIGSYIAGVASGGVIALDAWEDTSFTNMSYQERVVGGDEQATDKLLVIDVRGIILHESSATSLFSSGVVSAEQIQHMLVQASVDSRVKGVLLLVDSPGGSVSASDLIQTEVVRLQEQGVPVVAYFGETAASGGYYVSVSADRIVASPTTVTGSIGVIFQTFNISELLDEYGVEPITLTSGPYKDILSSTRPTSDQERDIMQSILDENFALFRSLVVEHRPVAADSEVFDGRVVSSRQALEYGLVDELGYEDAAVQALATAARTDTYQLIRYEEPFTFTDVFDSFGYVLAPDMGLASVLAHVLSERPRMMYLWQ